MILYGLLEPQWDFSAEAPNDVPRDMPDSNTAATLVHQEYYVLPSYNYPQPTRIYEAPRGVFMGEVGQGYWPTPSQALFIIPADTLYHGTSFQPPSSGSNKTGHVNQPVSYTNPQYIYGQAPTTGIYTGTDEEY